MTSYRLLMSLGLAAAALVPGTAVWTDSAEGSDTQITDARVDLKVQDADAVPSFTALSTSKLSPGGSVAGVLTVENSGNVALNYYLDSSATNPDGKNLAGALTVKVTSDSAVTGSARNRTCAGRALGGSRTSFGPSLLGSGASPRLLAAGASETVCVQASLSSTAPTSLQSAATAVSFTLPAATVRQAVWADTVEVSGTSIATITTPVLSCSAPATGTARRCRAPRTP
ncbi:MAG: hypothetical protein QOK15_838 [Nocardioidaceae bacterium]|nr:hypothetical protein [Nocardioidaceae bacterium]